VLLQEEWLREDYAANDWIVAGVVPAILSDTRLELGQIPDTVVQPEGFPGQRNRQKRVANEIASPGDEVIGVMELEKKQALFR